MNPSQRCLTPRTTPPAAGSGDEGTPEEGHVSVRGQPQTVGPAPEPAPQPGGVPRAGRRRRQGNRAAGGSRTAQPASSATPISRSPRRCRTVPMSCLRVTRSAAGWRRRESRCSRHLMGWVRCTARSPGRAGFCRGTRTQFQLGRIDTALSALTVLRGPLDWVGRPGTPAVPARRDLPGGGAP
jgi:hypothetical protein